MKTHPPKYSLKFLRWFCREDYIEEIEGDLIELFEQQFEKAPYSAKWAFFWRVIRYFRPEFVKAFRYRKSPIHTAMLYNYFKSAWRNLLKRKEFSLLNILGLAIGMAACLLIVQYVNHEISYDKFHPDGTQLYRVNLGMTDAGKSTLKMRATNHPAVGPSLREDFPQVEEFARLVDVSIFTGSSVLTYKPEEGQMLTSYEENMYVADSSLLTMFAFPLVAGDPLTALRGPDNLVISETIAKKYFGEEEPIGKTLTLNGDAQVTVTGVLKDLPDNTHLKINALFSSAFFSEALNSAWIWPEFYTYVKLAPHTDVPAFETQLDGFTNKYLGDIMKEFGIQEKMVLQPVKDIHLHGNLMKEAQENGNYQTVSFMVLIAIMILFIAWINYVNLSTSRSVERAKEVGIRKVVGAYKQHLISQFLMESALMNAMAIILALFLVSVSGPLFTRLTGISLNEFELMTNGITWGIIAIIFLGGTFVAGLYPAFILSSYQPVKTIKGKLFNHGNKLNFRHAMVVLQFTIGMVMIIGTLTVYHQLNFMRNQDMGFNMDQMLIVKTPSIIDSTYDEKAEILRSRLLQQPQIRHFTVSSDIPGHIIQNNNSIKKKEQQKDEAVFTTFLFTDEHYMETYGLQLVAGRNFSKDMTTDFKGTILNEKAVEQLGFTDPEDAIGQTIDRKLNQWEETKIIGVVKNIKHRSLAFEEEPMAFFNWQILIDYYSLKVSTEDLPGTIAGIEEAYNQVFPENPFEFFFLDDYFAAQYKADQQFGKVFSLFSGLAILVACLGLFGLTSYITARRTKEIGIRKIMGASVIQILVLLGKQFIGLVFIAALLALPLAWWGGDQWLSTYAFRAGFNLWIFVLPVISIVAIALITVYWQSMKVARSNPADSLRYE